MTIRNLGLLVLVGALSGCGDPELILSGDRYSPRDALLAPEPGADAEEAAAFTPTTEPENRSAPVANGGAQLGSGVVPAWAVNIGARSSRRASIATDPVVGDGRVFAMDAAAKVSAVSTGGALQWQRDLTPAGEQTGANGGGLAYAGGRLYVTTGYGEVSALDAASGAVLWSVRVDAPISGAPTVSDGTVYVVSRNVTGWALDAATGKTRWYVTGASSRSGMQGSAAPVIDGPRVIFPMPSGELVSADRGEGTKVWAAPVAGNRLGRGWTGYTDFSADPVMVGGMLIAANATGRIAAINPETAERLWTAKEGATGPLAVAGGDLFFVSDENRLMRLDASSGEKVWAIDLPYFTKTKEKRRAAIFAHYGPVLAGGRLVVASSDGLIRSFDPASGALIGTAELPGGAASQPVVAGGVFYLVTGDGKLHAFR